MAEKLAAIVDRVMTDDTFKSQLIQEPTVALEGYQLSLDEKLALKEYLVKTDDDVATIQGRLWH